MSADTTILYIEDDAFLARVVQRKLSENGYDVDVAADGPGGIERLGAKPYDLALIDYQLPGCDGIEVLKTAVALGSEAPACVMVSGVGELTTAVAALKAGADDYVVKDIDGSYLDLLPSVVGRVIERRRLEETKRRIEKVLEEQTRIVRNTLSNIDQGVALFDANLALVACNDRYRSFLRLPPALAAPGTPYADHARHVISETLDPVDVSAEVGRRVNRAASGDPFVEEEELPDGTVIDVRGRAMEGGGFVVTYTDISERKRMEEELRLLATRDPLTNASNRRHFAEMSTREIERCKRYGHPLSVIMLDADHFKKVNDTHGHDAGDRVLKAIAAVCMDLLRGSDIFGRFGGEEFVACLPETSLSVAEEVAERMRATLSETDIAINDGGDTLRVSVSVGVTNMGMADESFEAALNRADTALYEAKQAGRDRVVSHAFSTD